MQQTLRLLFRGPHAWPEPFDVDAVAEARQMLERSKRGLGEPAQSLEHQLDGLVAHALGSDAVVVPTPRRRLRVEDEQDVIGESTDELHRKERIAAGLV